MNTQFKTDRNIILNSTGCKLEHIPEIFRNDKEIVLIAVKNDYINLKFASEELKNDKDVVLTAIKNNNKALKYASKEFRKSSTFIMNNSIKVSHDTLVTLNSKLFDNKKFMIYCVAYDEYNFDYASNRLKNNKDFLLKIYKYITNVSKVMPNSLANDTEFIIELIKINSDICYYIENNRYIKLALYKYCSNKEIRCIVNEAYDYIGDDWELALELVKREYSYLKSNIHSFKNNEEFILEVVKYDGYALKYAEFQNEKIVLEAVKNNGWALHHAQIQTKEIVFEAVKSCQNAEVLNYSFNEFKYDIEITIYALQKNIHCVKQFYYYKYGKYLNDYKILISYLKSVIEPVKFQFYNMIFPDIIVI